MTLDPNMIAIFLQPVHAFIIVILYVIGIWLKKSGYFKDNLIPVALAIISLLLCVLYSISANPLPGSIQGVTGFIFNIIIQAFCCVASSVYFNQVGKQIVKMKTEEENNDKSGES